MTGPHKDGYGEIDWNTVWKNRQVRHEGSGIFKDGTHNWDKKENAARYDRGTNREADARVRMTIASLPITPSSRVLDIGAGPGTLAIPIAPLVKEVTAIEPGKGMAGILKENAKKAGITNIRCVEKRWEEVHPECDLSAPYDVVIASLSLTMEDIRGALFGMDAVSSGYVCLFWFANPPFWERMYMDLWPSLHGKAYHPGPKADCLFNVLYQMGIFANVEMLPLGKEYRFQTKKEMTAFFGRRFGVKTAPQRKVLDAYLAPLIRQDGRDVILSGESVLARIWWKKQG